MKRALLFLVALLWAGSAFAQSNQGLYKIDDPFRVLQNAATGTGDGTVLNVQGWGSVTLQVTGITDATVSFEASVDGTTWTGLGCSKSNDGSLVSSTTTNGQFICSIPGYRAIKVPVSAYTAGTITVRAVRSTAALGGGGGGGGGGGSITNILDGTGDSIMNSALNAAQVSCVAGCGGSGGTSMADDAPFTPGVTNISPTGYMFDDVTPDSVNEGDAGIPRMSANRVPYATIRDAAGNERGVNVNASNQLSVSVDNTPTVTIGTFPDNEPINLAQLGGTALAVPFDLDTGAGTQNIAGVSLRKGASGGSVELGTATDPIRVDPTGTTTQPISAASLPLPTGAATLAEQQTQTTALQLIDNLPLAQGSTTSGQSGILTQGAVTTAAPTYTTGQTSPLSLQTDGSIRTAITNTPTVTANAGTGDFLSIIGHTMNEAFKEAGAIGGQFDDTATTAATENNIAPLRITAQRGAHVNLRNASGTEIGTTSNRLITQIHDGTNSVTVRDAGTNDALNVAIVDAAGAHITSFGGGTQYTEGDTDTTVTGTAMMFESNTTTSTLSVVNANTPLPVHIQSTSVGTTADTDDGSITGGQANLTLVIDEMHTYDTGAGNWIRFQAQAADYDSGAGTENVTMIGIAVPASGGPIAVTGDATNGLDVDVTRVSGNVTVVQGTGTNLHIVCDSGCGGSGGTAQADESTFTEGTTSMTPIGGVFNNSIASDPTEDQAAAVRITAKRALHTSPYTPNGDSMSDDTNDAIRVNIVAGGGSGGTAMADDAAFTVASTNFTPVGGTYRSVRDLVDDNDGGAFAMTQRRALLTAIETPNGDSAMDDTNDSVKVTLAGTNSVNIGTFPDNEPFNVAQINGSTAQVASNGLNTTGGGLLASALVGQCDDTTPTALTENQFGHARINCTTHHQLIEVAAALPTGSNVIGAVTGSGTFTVDSELPSAAALADGASATPTTVTVGAVPLLMNATTVDRARAVVNGLDSTGTGIEASGLVAQLDDTATGAVTENQFAPVRLSTRRALLVEGVASGNALTVSGTVTANAGTGTLSTNLAQAAGNTLLTGNGVTGTGSPRVTIASDNTAFTVNVGTFPDNEPFNVAQVGGAAVVAGACQREQPIYVQINQTANTQLITGTSAERIYICSIHVVTATAQNIALVDGTGTTCGTGPTGLLGGSTAATGWNFAANGGINMDYHPMGHTKTSTDADNVCLLQSGAGQVSGSLSYVSLSNL